MEGFRVKGSTVRRRVSGSFLDVPGVIPGGFELRPMEVVFTKVGSSKERYKM